MIGEDPADARRVDRARAPRLSGRIVAVTGSTRGIGRAIALECAAEGAKVVVTGRTEALGRQVVDSIGQMGGQGLFVRGDVTVESDVEAIFAAALSTWGHVDGLVCNAATLDLGHDDGPVSELSLDTWNRILAADLTSVFLCAKYGTIAMMGGHGGAIVLIGSLSGARGINGMDAYSAAKGGVIALTRSIASYYARYDIRCNCLNLGFVDSGADRINHVLAMPGVRQMLLEFHLGQWGEPRHVATVAAHLLSREAEYINGVVIPVDGGAHAASHMPRPMVSDVEGAVRKREHAPLW